MGGKFSRKTEPSLPPEGEPPSNITQIQRTTSVKKVSKDRSEETARGEETWYLVTDSSGLTHSTLAFGEIHAAGKLMKAQEIGYRIWHKHKATMISLEADNIITAYRSVRAAFLAGVDFLIAVENNNQMVSDETFRLHIGGIGIAKDRDVAYWLGEKHAERSILMTPDGATEIQGLLNRICHGAISIRDVDHNIDGEIIDVPFNLISFRELRQTLTVSCRQLLLSAYNARAYLKLAVDQKIKCLSHWQEGITALIFEMQDEENEIYHDKFKLLLDSNKIHQVDESLCFAPNVDTALEFAFALNETFDHKCRFGIDYGKVLVIDRKMRVGSCINIASKIGQDHADWGDVAITSSAFAMINFAEVYDFTPKNASFSHVDIDYYIAKQKINFHE